MTEFQELSTLGDADLAEIIWQNEESDPKAALRALTILQERSWDNDEHDSALAWAERMESIADKSNLWTNVARAQFSQAEVHYISGQWDDAILDFNRSALTFEGLFDFKEQVRSLLKICDVYESLEEYGEMAKQASIAREIAIREECIQEAGDACFNLAAALHYKDDGLSETFNVHDENSALEIANEAIRFYSACANEDDMAYTEDLIARILTSQDKPFDALQIMQKVLAYWQSKNPDNDALDMVGETSIGVGVLLNGLDREQEAIEVFRIGLKAFEEVGDEYQICRLNMWMGDTLMSLGNYEEAIGVYGLAQLIPNGMDETFVRHRASWQISRCLWYLDRNQEALDLALENLNYFGKDPYFTESFFSRTILVAARVALDLEKWELLLEVLGRHTEIPTFIPIDGDDIEIDALRAKALYELGRIQDAFDIANAIIEGVTDNELDGPVGISYEVRARILEKLGQSGFEEDYIYATAIYVRVGNMKSAKRTAQRFVPSSTQRTRVPAPKQWPE
jgi:tetratricopeptide (TPR) repeat protein